MQGIYICGNNIFDLNNMGVLASFPNMKQENIYKTISMVGQELNVELAIIGLDGQLLNVLYAVFPNINVIINPLDVTEMINSHLRCGYDGFGIEEEVAISLEDSRENIFYHEFYKHRDKLDAIYHYKKWQTLIPLNCKNGHNIIRKIDFYCDEVFNYFEYSSIVDRCIKKALIPSA